MNEVYVKNISMQYGYEGDMKNSNLFTVRESEASEIFEQIVKLLVEYNFTNCRVSLGESFKTEDKNINTEEQVYENLITTFESLKDLRKSLKLTI